jgi:cobalt-zinc-cadmium efflux system membrane fusion protein
MSKKIYTVLWASIAATTLSACGDRGDSREHHADEKAGHGHAESEEAEHHDEVTIDETTAAELGVRTLPVGPGVVRDAHEVQGLLTPIEGKHARVRARYAGPIQAVRVGVGDVVKAGQTLAVVESNVSLTAYLITAPFAGTVLDVSAGPGDLAGDEPLFELADLSSLWVDLHLFGGDAQHIIPGLAVEVTRLSDGMQAATKLDRILPGTATASQSTVARATIRNADGQWRPGSAVRARVTVSQREAPLVVPVSALQTFEGETVVFTRGGNVYTPRTVKIGQRDATTAEVLGGLTAGEEIVVEQSYLIKADLEKESAAHEH